MPTTLPLLPSSDKTTNLDDFSLPPSIQTRLQSRRKYSSSSTPSSISTLSPSSSISDSDLENEQPLPSPPRSHRITLAHTPIDRALALNLLSASILEQRRTATRTLVTHPLNVICLLLATSLLTKACCYRRSWDDAPIVFLAITMLWLAWGTFIRILAGWGYARHAGVVRESEWPGSDEVLVVKVRTENDDAAAGAIPGDIPRRWWPAFLSSATRRSNRATGTNAERRYRLDASSLQYDLEISLVDSLSDEPEQGPEAIIGVLILRHVTSPSKLNRKGRGRGGQAWIRGWAVSCRLSSAAPFPSLQHDFLSTHPCAIPLTTVHSQPRSPQPTATTASAPPFSPPLFT